MKWSLFAFVLAACFAMHLMVASTADADAVAANQNKADFDLDQQLDKARQSSEKFEFQAEVNRMMKLIIHSLYKTKEIFLRELISNASDALDKIRFMSLTDANVLSDAKELNITIRADHDKKQLVITDTGVGMTKKELIKNLGTIAKSGTAEFLAAMENKNADSNLIGQFGVGFYSAFLVADKVTVISKNPKDKQHIWESYAESDFSVVEDPRGNTLGRGTQIILHLKEEDATEYLNEFTLEEIIKKYSEFINFPIYLQRNKTEEVEVEADEETPAADEKSNDDEKAAEDAVKPADDSEEAQVEDVTAEEKEKEEKKKKTEKRHYLAWERMNEHKPIWTRPAKNVSEEEYHEFYKVFSRDSSTPMAYLHFKAEGDVDFKSILYIPEKAPPNLLQSTEAHIKSIKLFVRRVFITDELLDFIPKYLGFLKGLVDSDDLPLNVSRETLQQHRLLKLIRKKVIRKAIEMIKNLSKDEEKYEKFLKEFGTNIKLGVIEDTRNRKKLLKLLRFRSSHSDKTTTLEDYVKRMKKNQPQIYFLTGGSLEEIKKSPFVELAVARGYEVLYLDEPIDEYMVQGLPEYERKPFQNVAKDGLKFGDEDDKTKEKQEEMNTKFKPLADYLQSSLDKFIEKVVVSSRLTTSPCAIIASQFGWSGHQERLMTAQALQSGEDPMRSFYASQKKTLEINPRHPLIESMLAKVEAKELDSLNEVGRLLYEATALRSGYSIKDTADFASRVERVIRTNLGVDLSAQASLDDIEAAPEADEEDQKKESEKKADAEEVDAEEKLEKDDDEPIEHDEL